MKPDLDDFPALILVLALAALLLLSACQTTAQRAQATCAQAFHPSSQAFGWCIIDQHNRERAHQATFSNALIGYGTQLIISDQNNSGWSRSCTHNAAGYTCF